MHHNQNKAQDKAVNFRNKEKVTTPQDDPSQSYLDAASAITQLKRLSSYGVWHLAECNYSKAFSTARCIAEAIPDYRCNDKRFVKDLQQVYNEVMDLMIQLCNDPTACKGVLGAMRQWIVKEHRGLAAKNSPYHESFERLKRVADATLTRL